MGALVKAVHKLCLIKDGMLKSTLMRTFETYAEEIEIFPMNGHHSDHVRETRKYEASFILTYTKRNMCCKCSFSKRKELIDFIYWMLGQEFWRVAEWYSVFDTDSP